MNFYKSTLKKNFYTFILFTSRTHTVYETYCNHHKYPIIETLGYVYILSLSESVFFIFNIIFYIYVYAYVYIWIRSHIQVTRASFWYRWCRYACLFISEHDNVQAMISIGFLFGGYVTGQSRKSCIYFWRNRSTHLIFTPFCQ